MCLVRDVEPSRSGVLVCNMSLRRQLARRVICVVLCLTISAILLNVRRCFGNFRTPEWKYSVGTSRAVLALERVRSLTMQPEDTDSQYHNAGAKNVHSDETNEGLIHTQISSVCARNGLRTPLIKSHFLYNPYHGSLYCWIRKAASSTFTKLFSDMRSRYPMRDYYKETSVLAPRTMEELQNLLGRKEIFKLLIVRHPFRRIVSSYRDRIEDNTKYTDQAWIYAKRIFRVTRPNIFRSNTSVGALQKIFTPDRRLKIIPSFEEFVEWLVQTPSAGDDVHWVPYHTHCAACSIRYDFVLKIDDYTFNEISYLLPKIGANTTAAHLPKLEASHGGPTDFKTACGYIGTLKRATVMKLYERYRIDFEMYNYSIDKYVTCIRRYK